MLAPGLGLPLSRALAKAANGWLGLEDKLLSGDLSVSRYPREHAATTG